MKRFAPLLIVLLVLTGCASPAVLRGDDSTPAVGSCHALTVAEQFDTESDSAPDVSCRTLHTTETFSVQDAPARFAAIALRPGSESRRAIVAEICTPAILRSYLSAREDQSLYDLFTIGFLPTAAAWTAGARWVRCDVAPTRSEASLVPLGRSHTLARAMTGSLADRFSRCYRQALGSDGRLSQAGTDVPCSEPHTSRDVNVWLPTYTAVTHEQIVELCTAAVVAAGGAPTAVSAVVRGQKDATSRTVHCSEVDSDGPVDN